MPEPTNPIAGYGSDFNPTPVKGNPWAFDCVMISAGPSAASSYLYPPAFIADPKSIDQYQGAQCYLNHLSEEELVNRPEGDMRDLVGFWTNVHAEGGQRLGRLNIIPTDRNKWVRDYCAAAPEYRKIYPDKNLFGVSIVQLGDWVPEEFQGKTYRKVINTNEAMSCDIVTRAGRGGMVLAAATGESNRKLFENLMQESTRVVNRAKLQKESVPAGWKGTVHAMLDKPEIDNPYALVNWMDDQGYTSHKPEKESGASASAFAMLDRPGTQPLVTAEAGQSQLNLLSILTELRDKVAAAEDSMPLKKELRRGLDNAVTAAQIGRASAEGERPMATKQEVKTEPGMSVTISHAHPPAGSAPPGAGPQGAQVPGAHQEPDGDEEEALRCEEAEAAFKKMAEAETESEKKAGYLKQAEAFKKMSEARRTKMAEAKRQREAEEETKRKEEESKRTNQMSESEKEEESMRALMADMLLKESGLDEKTQGFIRESTRGRKLSEIRSMVETAKTTLMREANPPLNPSRPHAGAGAPAGFKAAFLDWAKGGKK